MFIIVVPINLTTNRADLMRKLPQFIKNKLIGSRLAVTESRLAATSTEVDKKGILYSTKEDMSVEGSRRDRDREREQLRDFDDKLS